MIYSYTSVDGRHLNPDFAFESIGYAPGLGKHYFFVADGVEIPPQPEEIGWTEVTDEEELAAMQRECPAFFGDAEAARARFGL